MRDEIEIIERIRARAGPDKQLEDRVVAGIGDDAAVIATQAGTDLIACCDLMVEGVHFRREWAPPRLIGRKALASTLSDIAAMGGIARFTMTSVALPAGLPDGFVEDLFDGILELAAASGVALVGGDTSRSTDSIFIDVSLIGECQMGRAIRRNGAQPGEAIYVTGYLGASALGLKLLEAGFRLNGEGCNDSTSLGALRRQAVLKHLVPQPRLEAGRALGEGSLAGSMIDLSDGLSTDLSHILDESAVGATIQEGALPVAECVRALAVNDNTIDPPGLALNGGEDYELLFTASRESERALADIARKTGIPLTRIGEITSERGLRMERDGEVQPVQPAGYRHTI
jgi:thiamine-monophosphate kinase